MTEPIAFTNLEAALRQVTDTMRRPPVATIPLPNLQAKRGAVAFAPVSNDPTRLANATVQSVGRIGDASAEEIEKVREELRRGYEEIDAKLQQLAEAFRGHAKVAGEHVSSFCLLATDFFDTINAANRKLQGRQGAQELETPAEPEPADNGEPAPEFLTRGG